MSAAPTEGVLARPLHLAMFYFMAGALFALSQGLGQGFVSVNTQQIAGDLGITQTDAAWLQAAYMFPRASVPLLLIKIRTQFGLRRFAEVGIIAYVLVSFASVWIDDLRSAITVQFLSGIASAPLSSLAFLYFLEPLSRPWKLRIGLPLALVFLMNGPTLARVVSPLLIGDGGLEGVHLTALGMALASLALVYTLKLTPVPHQKVIRPLDLVSFALIAFAFGGLTVAFIQGPIRWWTDMDWIGWLLAGAFLSLAVAVVIELHRKEPLLDIHWLATPAMVHLTIWLLLFRLLLSEQSTGAPRMFQVMGIGQDQMVGLFGIICIANLLGALACLGWMRPGREAQFHCVALVLIAAGAWMDSQSSMDTRPEQMIVSQALIGFAGMLFMPPAMMQGLIAALTKGPNYILSFVIVFLATQSLGGVVGSGFFLSFINHQQAAHLQVLREQITATSPATMTGIANQMALLAPQIADTTLRRAEALALIAQDAANQAYVMAYNDAYRLTFVVALVGLAYLMLHVLRDLLVSRRLMKQAPSPEARK
ncbi:MFS transporter [Paenirhodobacter sp.]|uniref:MFS transporter n=1 Tax=Paenirhodobacter sp. TaxID=1965326 RepID=UPI003B3E5D1E